MIELSWWRKGLKEAHYPRSNERPCSLFDEFWLVHEYQCRGEVIELWVHAQEPRAHCLWGLDLKQEPHDRIDIAEALCDIGIRLPFATCPTNDLLRILDTHR